jgi:glucan phosphorylase
MDAEDAEALYSTLENQVVPTFYSRNDDGLPSLWIGMMKNAIATLATRFSSDRMVRQYLTEIYQIDK